MRILTLAEVRQIERIRNLIVSYDITGIDTYDKDDNLVDDFNLNRPDDKELWLNILDLAIQANDATKESWRKDKAPNLTDEVRNKLRPKP